MKQTSITFAMARFIFISYLALALLTTFIVVTQAVKSVDEQQQAFVALETDTINHNYRQFISNHQMILQEQSEQPLIVQSMMQGDVNILKVAEYFRHLKFLGRQHQLSLLDFEGQFIYSTQDNSAYHHTNSPWLGPLLTGKKARYLTIKKIENHYYWVLAQSVKYNGQVEGIITVTIDIDTINQSVKGLTGLAIELFYQAKPIALFGKFNDGIKRTIEWPQQQISIEFTYDDTSIKNAIDQLIIQLTVFIVIAILIITCFAYLFARRYIVNPILNLNHATSSLEDGEQHTPLTTDIKITELANLTTSFNNMSATIVKREQALLASQKQLIKSHEDLKESEAQRLQNEKMASLGVLVAGIAHEINNPIGFVKSNIDTLQEYWLDIQALLDEMNQKIYEPHAKLLLDELYQKYDATFVIDDISPLIDSTNDGISRVTEIIRSLKTFARTNAPDMVMADVNEGLTATLVMAQNELKYHCDITTELGQLPTILMYPSKINQVFMNLLLNAGQAIEERGEITIKTYTQDNDIVIEISDTGSGIAPDKITQIFTPFYTSKPVGQGTGLGLAISHKIIKQHHGRIDVKSTLGHGSCFKVILPIITAS